MNRSTPTAKKTVWLAVAALAIGGMSYSASAADNAANNGQQAQNSMNKAAQNVQQAAENVGDAARNAADQKGAGNPTTAKPAPDAKDIRSFIGDITSQAVTKSDMDKMVGNFVDADRNRINKDLSNQKQDDYGKKLDGRIAQIQKAWKAKYGHEFDLDNAQAAFSDQFMTIQQGRIGSDAQLASEVEANSKNALQNGNTNANGNSAGDENLEKGRSIAVVTVKANDNLPEVEVPLIHELPDNWKINTPDSMTGKKLRQNLLDQMTAIGKSADQWPTQGKDAYRVVAHRVLMAVLNKNASSS